MTMFGKAVLLFSFLWIFLSAAAPAGAVETTIKGGRMELLNKGESVRFTEGVRLDRGGDRLKAAQMQTNRQRDKVTAKGDVRLFRKVSSTETWEAFGDSGFYDTQTGSGTLLGTRFKKAHVVHTEIISSTMTRIVHLYAARIEFYRESKKCYAAGAVEGNTVDPSTGERFDFKSERADFDGEKKQIVLSGQPQSTIVQTTKEGRRTVTGDKIVYYTELKRMKSEGKARAVFERKKDGSKKK